MTLNELKNEVADEFAVLLEDELAASEPGELRSPEFFEQVMWNVVIAFFVNLLASAAHDKIKSTHDSIPLSEIRSRADEIEISVKADVIEDEQVARAIEPKLPQSLPSVRRKSLSLKLALVLKRRIRDGARPNSSDPSGGE